jgi:positive regulator of sigma E activity
MTRLLVLAAALVFIVGLAGLTIAMIKAHGLNAGGVVSIFVVVMLAVGIVGALRNPPRY